MEMRNCPRCKKIFHYSGVPICPDCVKADETLFEEVRQYIKDHPNCPLAEVSEATGCTVKRILRYVREGRLEISNGMEGEVTCENCGKNIKKGRYCDACVIELTSQVDGLFGRDRLAEPAKSKPQPTGRAKMHLDRKKPG